MQCVPWITITLLFTAFSTQLWLLYIVFCKLRCIVFLWVGFSFHVVVGNETTTTTYIIMSWSFARWRLLAKILKNFSSAQHNYIHPFSTTGRHIHTWGRDSSIYNRLIDYVHYVYYSNCPLFGATCKHMAPNSGHDFQGKRVLINNDK